MAALAIPVLLSCKPKGQPVTGAAENAGAPTNDSLVASDGKAVEVWFTLSRSARGRNGARCIERGLEIRRGGARIPVPLLYTGTAPTLLDSSTMRAELWNHCQPVDTYLVDLRSGQPVREGARRKP